MSTEIPTHNKAGFPVVPCDRCCGEGGMEHFSHVDGGRCFKCHGQRVVVRPGKAAKQYKAYQEACEAAQAATLADLKEGDVFTLGGPRVIARWQTFVRLAEDPSESNRANGWIKVVGSKSSTSVQGMNFPVRINRPGVVDVNEYLKGL